MKLKIYTVYDSAAMAYITPFFMPTDGQATRVFSDAVNDRSHPYGRHPHDYTLFSIGEFDDGNASMKTNPPGSIGNGLEFVTPPENTNQPELKGIAS